MHQYIQVADFYYVFRFQSLLTADATTRPWWLPLYGLSLLH
jgi:hypothetical protein